MPMDLNVPSPPYRYSGDGRQFERNWQADLQSHWSPGSVRQQLGNEHTSDVSPRSLGRPPRAKLVLPQAKTLGKEGTAAAQPGESSPDVLTPRRRLEKLGRFRERHTEVGSDSSEA